MLLDVMDEHGARATFFVLGTLAEKEPELIEEIAVRGHEVGSHGYDHANICDTTSSEFTRSEKRVIDLLRDITGVRPLGFRAPNFSVTTYDTWLFKVLERELGYLYSSSVFPMRSPIFGLPGAPLHPHLPNRSMQAPGEMRGEGLVEFPVAVYRAAGMSIPVGGGGYLRFLPVRLVSLLLGRVIRERPAVVYIHPRDFYPLEENPGGMSALHHAALFHGVEGTMSKLIALMKEFRFHPVREVLSL
jgi:peptidoglycan-N-acetylglucosamine deacetylase